MTELTTHGAPPVGGDCFRPPLDERAGRYRLRFASSDADRDAIYRLRFEVFNLELGEGLKESIATGLDRDRYDEQCHHLLVDSVDSGRTIGTYRMQLREIAEAGVGFYSASEFDLAALDPRFLDGAIELGRACITREHRHQRVLFLLWRGLASYLLWNRRRYLLGCSSITTQDPDIGLRLYEALAADGKVHPEARVEPLPSHVCVPSAAPGDDPAIPLPPLFATYMRYGAHICGPPAVDRQFQTIDFLTLLDARSVSRRRFEAFGKGLPGYDDWLAEEP